MSEIMSEQTQEDKIAIKELIEKLPDGDPIIINTRLNSLLYHLQILKKQYPYNKEIWDSLSQSIDDIELTKYHFAKTINKIDSLYVLDEKNR